MPGRSDSAPARQNRIAPRGRGLARPETGAAGSRYVAMISGNVRSATPVSLGGRTARPRRRRAPARALRRTGCAAAILLLASTAAGGAAAAPDIGEATLVEVWAYRMPTGGQGWTDLYKWDDVFAEDTVRTAPDGATHLRFDDDTRLRVGPSSRVVLDRFVYDPDRGTGEFVAHFGTGVFRFISGRMPKQSIRLETPTVVVGIRGTDLVLTVRPDGSSRVDVLEGEAVVRPKAGGEAVPAPAGRSVSVSADGGDAETGRARRPATGSGLDEGGGRLGGPAGGGGGDGGGQR